MRVFHNSFERSLARTVFVTFSPVFFHQLCRFGEKTVLNWLMIASTKSLAK